MLVLFYFSFMGFFFKFFFFLMWTVSKVFSEFCDNITSVLCFFIFLATSYVGS